MSKDPRRLGVPQASGCEEAYCGPCKCRQPHVKHTAPGSTYATSKCLVCNPGLLDAADYRHHFPFEAFDRFETRRLIRVRDRHLGAGLRVVLKGDGATSVEALVAHFENRGAA